MDDLADREPLPPPPRKKYLSHPLYGLAPAHRALMVAQLNGQLRRHAKNRRGVPLPVGGSLRDPVRVTQTQVQLPPSAEGGKGKVRGGVRADCITSID